MIIDFIEGPLETVAVEGSSTHTITEYATEAVTFGTQGPPGATGAKGDTGATGAPGVSGASFEFVQSIAQASWVIVHNLNRYPAVVAVDSAGDTVEGEVTYDSRDQVTLSYSAPFGGRAFLN